MQFMVMISKANETTNSKIEILTTERIDSDEKLQKETFQQHFWKSRKQGTTKGMVKGMKEGIKKRGIKK